MNAKNWSGIDDGMFTDQALVEQARHGDQVAFGELVRRHRAKAFGWAAFVTRDDFTAEDIVQDALIRAFLHLGKLLDSARFVPWLQRIVYNQAYTKLRRGGPYRKEQPFSSYIAISADNVDGEYGDVDRIIQRLMKTDLARREQESNPAEMHMKNQLYENIMELLHCLSRREKEIFEAFFFEQIPPKEIARLFQTTTSNVYNSLSRSRVKVRQERIRVYIADYIENRKKTGCRRKVLLDCACIQF